MKAAKPNPELRKHMAGPVHLLQIATRKRAGASRRVWWYSRDIISRGEFPSRAEAEDDAGRFFGVYGPVVRCSTCRRLVIPSVKGTK